jgi:argininosuccinate synthase
MKARIVVACSGALDVTTALPLLARQYEADVVAMTLDLGQGQELEEVRDRALASGAVRAHVLDVREEFARDYVLPTLHAGALREGHDPMAAALAAPLVSKKLSEVAAIEQARDVVDRFGMQPNLWGRAGGAFVMTKAPADAPEAAADVEISFDRGTPVAINGVPMGLTELIEILNIIAGHHGIGRMDMGETQGEAPAAVVLHAAHRTLEAAVLPTELVVLKHELSLKYAELIWNGQWFTPMREALDAFNASTEAHMTGEVRIRLLQGQHTIPGLPS